MSHANAAEPIECRPDMRGSASPRVMGPSKSADCNQQQEQQQEDAKFFGGKIREDKGIVWHYLIPSPPTFVSQLALIFGCHCRKLTVLSQTPVLNLIGKEKTRRE